MIAAAAFALVVAGGMVKGVLGIGLPMVVVPTLTLLVGLPTALSILAIPMICSNLWQVWQFRKSRSQRIPMGLFMASGAFGVGMGVWLLANIPAQWIEAGLGGLLLTYLAMRFAQPDMVLSPAGAARIAPVIGFGSGALHGATGISGPLGVTYFHSMRLLRPDFVFCTGLMFLGFTSVQLPLLYAAGFFDAQTAKLGLLCLPAVALGLVIGNWIARRVDKVLFDRLVLAIIVWMTASLLWRSIPEILAS